MPRIGSLATGLHSVIDESRERGAIQHIGVSNVSVDEIERARELAPIAAVQNHYNLSERTHDDVVDYCAENDIVSVPYFPLRADAGRAAAEIAVALSTRNPHVCGGFL